MPISVPCQHQFNAKVSSTSQSVSCQGQFHTTVISTPRSIPLQCHFYAKVIFRQRSFPRQCQQKAKISSMPRSVTTCPGKVCLKVSSKTRSVPHQSELYAKLWYTQGLVNAKIPRQGHFYAEVICRPRSFPCQCQ